MGVSPVVRRHRLPHPYRVGLATLWVAPLLLFVFVMALKRGIDLALLDPRFLLLALLMIVPAIYFWQEGIDVLPDGIVRRIHVPRYYPFAALARWHYDRRPDRHVLTIWDAHDQKIVECRAGHLTDFSKLLETLEEKLR